MTGYGSSLDALETLGVWCFRGKNVEADAWQRHLDDMNRVANWTRTVDRPSVLLHLSDDRFIPNASQRKQIVEVSGNPNYRPNIALITASPVVRGILRTFSWFQGSCPYRVEPFEGVADGIRWLEQERGRPLPRLLDMVESVHRTMGISPIVAAMAKKQLNLASA